jgi:NitT/TauT family transport system substrate-binding protein
MTLTPLRGRPRLGRVAIAMATLPLLAGLAACGGQDGAAAEAGAVDLNAGAPADALRLGFFGNVTHAPALIGVGEGLFAKELGATKLETQVFNAGPAAIEALVAGAIDATYIGPNPAINGFVQSEGTALRIVAGSTSGGAQLVVRPEISGPADLKGKNVASPQLGNTQDVALRAWLADNGLRTSTTGGGDVTITPTENAQTLQLFQDGKLDGAWVPEPWASRLVLDAGAKVLVDEKDLWPGGRFVTTHLIVATKFLEEHPQTVEALVRGNVAAIAWIGEHGAEAQSAVNAQIEKASGKPLEGPVIARAFQGIELTPDPVAASLQKSFDDSVAAGISKEASLTGIYDLRLLNKVLTEQGQPKVSAGGLGEE